MGCRGLQGGADAAAGPGPLAESSPGRGEPKGGLRAGRGRPGASTLSCGCALGRGGGVPGRRRVGAAGPGVGPGRVGSGCLGRSPHGAAGGRGGRRGPGPSTCPPPGVAAATAAAAIYAARPGAASPAQRLPPAPSPSPKGGGSDRSSGPLGHHRRERRTAPLIPRERLPRSAERTPNPAEETPTPKDRAPSPRVRAPRPAAQVTAVVESADPHCSPPGS